MQANNNFSINSAMDDEIPKDTVITIYDADADISPEETFET